MKYPILLLCLGLTACTNKAIYSIEDEQRAHAYCDKYKLQFAAEVFGGNAEKFYCLSSTGIFYTIPESIVRGVNK